MGPIMTQHKKIKNLDQGLYAQKISLRLVENSRSYERFICVLAGRAAFPRTLC